MGIVQLPFPPGKYTEKGTGQVPQKNKTFGGSLVCKSGSFSMPRKVIVFYDDIQTMTTHFCGLGMRAGSC